MKTLIYGLVLAGLLSGCATVPHYHRIYHPYRVTQQTHR